MKFLENRFGQLNIWQGSLLIVGLVVIGLMAFMVIDNKINKDKYVVIPAENEQ